MQSRYEEIGRLRGFLESAVARVERLREELAQEESNASQLQARLDALLGEVGISWEQYDLLRRGNR